MFTHEILKKNNSDIWRLIYAAGKKYGFIKMKHTKAHMDRTVKAEDLSEDSRGNIMADKLAEEMHNGENSISATEMASCLTSNLYYNNVPVTMAIRRWMPYMVQVENARRYWLTHMPEQERSAICWETMHESVKDLKHITRRVNFMKILWGTFEYQQKKMEHRFIPASQNKCAFCNKFVETQDHVLRCEAGEAGSIRKSLMRKIARELLDSADDETKESRGGDDDFEAWVIKVMNALLKRGDRVVPKSGMGKLDSKLEKLNEEGVDLFHRCIVTKEFVNILNVLVAKKSDAVKLARKINAITQDAIVEIWKENKKIHDLNKQATAGDHSRNKSNMMRDARRLRNEGILDRYVPGRVSLSWQEFCNLSLKQKTNIVNKRKRFLEIEEEVAIPWVGMDVRIYGRTKKGVQLFAGKIKSIDLQMDKRRSTCVVELAADASITKELKLRSVSRNTCTKKKPFTERELGLIDHIVTKGGWIGSIAKLLPPERKNTKQHVRSISSVITNEPRVLIITDEGLCKKMQVSDLLETGSIGPKMLNRTRSFRNKTVNALRFGINQSLPILNCPLLLLDQRSRAVKLSNAELIKGVAFEKFSSCLDSSESESSLEEDEPDAMCKQPKKKVKYANWRVSELEKELKERGLCCPYKRGEKRKLVK